MPSVQPSAGAKEAKEQKELAKITIRIRRKKVNHTAELQRSSDLSNLVKQLQSHFSAA